MTQDTVRARVEREAANFAALYDEFVRNHDDKIARDEASSPWLSLFEMPLRPLDNDGKGKAKSELQGKPYEAVVKTIRALKLHNLQLGSLSSTDGRLLDLEDLGFSAENMAPQYTIPADQQQQMGLKPIKRDYLDYSDPFFWRTLVEIFCRVFTSAHHGATPWTQQKTVELALDMIEINETILAWKWNANKVRHRLRQAPYRDRYPGPSDRIGGVGEDRIRTIVKLIGPMDGSASSRLHALFPNEFSAALRKRRRPKTVKDIQARLSQTRAGQRRPKQSD